MCFLKRQSRGFTFIYLHDTNGFVRQHQKPETLTWLRGIPPPILYTVISRATPYSYRMNWEEIQDAYHSVKCRQSFYRSTNTDDFEKAPAAWCALALGIYRLTQPNVQRINSQQTNYARCFVSPLQNSYPWRPWLIKARYDIKGCSYSYLFNIKPLVIYTYAKMLSCEHYGSISFQYQ